MAASEENEPVMAISARIEIVQSHDLLDEPTPTRRRDPRTLPRDRQIAGLVSAALGVPLVTQATRAPAGRLSLEVPVLLFLAGVGVVAVISGIVAAIPTAIVA